MNRSEFSGVIEKRGIKKGDRILVVLRNGDVNSILFVGLEEGNDEKVDLKMHWIFDDGEVSEKVLISQCPYFILSNIDAILPARNVEEVEKFNVKLLVFLTKIKIILEKFLREILT